MITTRTIWSTIAILIFLNLAGAALYGYMLYDISLQRSSTTLALTTLQMELERGGNLKQLSDALSSTVDERAKIDGYFVDTKGSAHFLEKLQSFGKLAEAPIHLSSVEVENKSVLRVGFSVEGSFENIYQLTELLQATPYVINIRSLNLNKINITDTAKNAKQKVQLWSATFSVRLLSFSNK